MSFVLAKLLFVAETMKGNLEKWQEVWQLGGNENSNTESHAKIDGGKGTLTNEIEDSE